jgi:hypothetical protein
MNSNMGFCSCCPSATEAILQRGDLLLWLQLSDTQASILASGCPFSLAIAKNARFDRWQHALRTVHAADEDRWFMSKVKMRYTVLAATQTLD